MGDTTRHPRRPRRTSLRKLRTSYLRERRAKEAIPTHTTQHTHPHTGPGHTHPHKGPGHTHPSHTAHTLPYTTPHNRLVWVGVYTPHPAHTPHHLHQSMGLLLQSINLHMERSEHRRIKIYSITDTLNCSF